MGIGIPHNEVVLAAESIGCLTFSASFKILGVKVGGIMSRRSSWDEIIAKLTSRQSKRKLKTLSIGGRLTLIKSVLSSLPLYHMSIFKCPMSVLKLLESTRQNFFNGVTNSDRRLALIRWKKVLDSKKNGGLGVSRLYGPKGVLDNPHIINIRSPWLYLIREFKSLSFKDKQVTVASKLRDTSLVSSLEEFREELPMRLNLSLRGVDIPSILYLLCSITTESSSHLLFSCHLAWQLMIKVARWGEIVLDIECLTNLLRGLALDHVNNSLTGEIEKAFDVEVKDKQEKNKIESKPDKNGKRGEAGRMSFRRVVPRNYDPKGDRFLIASRFPTPPLACAFFSPGATVTKFNRYSFFETPKVLLLAWDRVFEIKDAPGTKQSKPEDIQELFRQLLNDVQNIHEELAEYINTPGWNRPVCYDDDDDDDDVDYTIAITPVLSTEEPIDSLSMGDEHLDTIPATGSDKVIKSSVEDLVPILSESEGITEHMCDVPFHDNSPPLDVLKDQIEDFSESNNEVSSIDDDSFFIDNIDYVEASPPDSELVSSEVMEIVIPKVGRIDDDILLTIKDDILREKLLNVNLFIAKIDAFNDNPTPSSDCKTKSSSTSLNSLLEESNTFYNSLPEFENFYFDLGEISSGSTTTHSDISLPDYEAFYFDNDHVKEISSGSPTTHFDISLFEYDSFIFYLTHEEFVDEFAHIISPPEYDCFYFWNLPDPGELMSVLNFRIRENLSITRVNLPVEDDHSPLLAYVVWIFLAYLTYPIIPPYLYPFGNEDTIFDPGNTINHFYSFKPGLSHRYGAFKEFNTHRSHLNEWLMIINGKNIPILDVLLFHFYPP
nr:RNA-directed DNA polymerase, eukaryota [Tanacetum cinerariifolium]